MRMRIASHSARSAGSASEPIIIILHGVCSSDISEVFIKTKMYCLIGLICLQIFSLALGLPQDKREDGTLTVIERNTRDTDARIVAVYQSFSGDEIRISTSPHSLTLTTTDQNTNLVTVKDVPVLMQSYGDSGKARYLQILNRAFISSNDQLYRIANSDSIETAVMSSPLTNNELIAKLQGELVKDQQNVMEESIRILMDRPEMNLLEPAARSLADNLGVTGKDDQAAMVFLASAMRLSDAHNVLNDPQERYISRVTEAQIFASAQQVDCQDTCPPCPDNECVGLCGKKCTCWTFVCGDCCAHAGCYQHDLCCINHGFFSFTCLFPSGFTCENYEC